MKTVIIYDDKFDVLRFAVVDGDYQHLDGVYINGAGQSDEQLDALDELLFDNATHHKKLAFSETFPVDAVRDGAA